MLPSRQSRPGKSVCSSETRAKGGIEIAVAGDRLADLLQVRNPPNEGYDAIFNGSVYGKRKLF